MQRIPTATMKVGQQVNGFEVKDVAALPGLRATAYRIGHARSGARLLHVHAADAENLFSISFVTAPPDDTGLPHILEHSVLAGSRKFPVKEPFFEMLKMSMATFINAMTGQDITYYPVASNNHKDLFNLAEVYFDAVFYPLLTEQTFQREAHHLAPADKARPAAELTLSGIVYSEMKSAYSHAESILYRASARELFPDTAYGRDSGGDPDRIPDLTYEGLKGFHAAYYHPSNAYFFLYGDIPTKEYLAFLAEKLGAFDRRQVEPEVLRQRRWDKPRASRERYPVGRDEPTEAKTYATINWLAGDGTDPQDVVAMDVLSRVLFGHEAAPLKKAIIDSQLGKDVTHCFFWPRGPQSTLHVGVKGTEANRVEAFEALVVKTLSDIAEGDIPAEWVAAALQQAAYRHLEIGSMYPLRLMQNALSAWPYGADPLTFLRMKEHLEAFRQRHEKDPRLLNRLIAERLVDNPHRLTVLLEPDRDEQARRDEALARRMKHAREALSDEQATQIAEVAAELERMAGEPNSPEALATLPQLKVSDLPGEPRHIPTAVETLAGGVEVLRNDVFANGVNYLRLDFDLTGLPAELYAYLPRYCDAVRKGGAAGMNYEQIARRVAACTGGIGAQPYFHTHGLDAGRSLRRISIGLRALDERMEAALELLGDLLFRLDPRDAERLRDVTVQARARCETELVRNGLFTAICHAARGVSVEGHLAEIVEGLPQLPLVRRLTDQFDAAGEELMAKTEALRDFLLNRRRLTVSFTGSAGRYELLCRVLSGWIEQMRDEPVADEPVRFTPYASPPREGLAAPMQVAHCAAVMPAPHFSDPDEPLMSLGGRMISLEYCLPEIRFKGNAYGAGCRYDGLGRLVAMFSYADPRLAETLDVFGGVLDYVRAAEWTQDDIDRAIIGKAKEDEQPIRPEVATVLALRRHLTGQTPQRRQARYARIVAAKPTAVKDAVLAMLEPNLPRAAICVVSSREKLEAANRQRPDAPLAIEDILT